MFSLTVGLLNLSDVMKELATHDEEFFVHIQVVKARMPFDSSIGSNGTRVHWTTALRAILLFS